MPLAGEKLTIKEALALCYWVGFRGDRLTTAVAVMSAESGRYTRAWNDNEDQDGEVWSVDRGLFQINSYWHPELSEEEAYKPILNAAYAFEMSDRGQHWTGWAAYKSGAYLKFVEEIDRVRKFNPLWRLRVSRVEKRFG